MAEMAEVTEVDHAVLSGKARLFDEFLPDQRAVTTKLEALALQVEVMFKVLKAADVQVGRCSLDRIDAAIASLESAGSHYHERLREFTVVYSLIRDNVAGVSLLASWQEYAKRYHEQVESRAPWLENEGR